MFMSKQNEMRPYLCCDERFAGGASRDDRSSAQRWSGSCRKRPGNSETKTGSQRTGGTGQETHFCYQQEADIRYPAVSSPVARDLPSLPANPADQLLGPAPIGISAGDVVVGTAQNLAGVSQQ